MSTYAKPSELRGSVRHSRRSQSLAAAAVLAAAVPCAKAAENCSSEWRLPGPAPVQASDYNGHALPEVCLGTAASNNVFIIGDWGGIDYGGAMPPIPADKRSKLFGGFHRAFVWGVDDRAQLLVANQMRKRARMFPPDLVLNVGDNFYWGGVAGKCGEPPCKDHKTGQWQRIFEDVYWGPGLDGKPWFGVLGNHDYGGYQFQAAWENSIGYSWGYNEHSTKRWRTPAQYYSQKVNYDGFSVDYYFVDTNVMEAFRPEMNPAHNLCGLEHNGEDATCGPGGPHDIKTCPDYFHSLWENQMAWMEASLAKSTSTWQVVTTHFPPKWAEHEWHCLSERYGLDLIVSGHLHSQRMFSSDDPDNWLPGTTVVISGGGGGITCEGHPTEWGDDDQYGFAHLSLSPDELKVEAISHGGILRKTMKQKPRGPDPSKGQCFNFNIAANFKPMDGGVGRGCRGKDASDSAGTNYMLEQDVPTVQSCMRKCTRTPQCTGIEFGDKVCQLWTQPINASIPLEGFECLLRVPGNNNSADPPPEPKETSKLKEFQKDFGADHECRAEGNSRAASDFLPGTAPSLESCEKLCLMMGDTCKGIEYGPGTVCNRWQSTIHGSASKPGVTCIPSSTKAVPQGTISEVASLLHV